MKTKQPFNKYTILSFIIAYHQKASTCRKTTTPKIPTQQSPLQKNRLSIHTTPTPTQRQLSTHSNYSTQTPGQFQHFSRRRGADGEGFVQGTGTSLQGEASRAALLASMRFRLV